MQHLIFTLLFSLKSRNCSEYAYFVSRKNLEEKYFKFQFFLLINSMFQHEMLWPPFPDSFGPI